MIFDYTTSLSDIILIIGLALTFISLRFGFLQFSQSQQFQKAKFLSEITDDLCNNTELRDFFYTIDYETFRFPRDDLSTFQGSDGERLLDSLLYKYNFLGRLVRMKILKIEEIGFLLFEINQVMNNDQVLDYIDWLSIEYKKHGNFLPCIEMKPFSDAQWLVKQTLNNSIT